MTPRMAMANRLGEVLKENVDVVCFQISIKIKLTCKATQSKKKKNNPNCLGAKHTNRNSASFAIFRAEDRQFRLLIRLLLLKHHPANPYGKTRLIPHHAAVKMINKMGRSPGGFSEKERWSTSWILSSTCIAGRGEDTLNYLNYS